MSTKHRILVAVVVAGLVVAGAAAVVFLRGTDRVDETLALQERLLSGDLDGRERKEGVTQVVRAIDKMDRTGVKRVQDALVADWRQLRQKACDDYFAASEADRLALLDRDIRRLFTAGELWFATSPRSNGQPPRPRPRKKVARQPEKAPARKQDAAEKLDDIYRGAILARAKTRGITMPPWLLDGPPR